MMHEYLKGMRKTNICDLLATVCLLRSSNQVTIKGKDWKGDKGEIGEFSFIVDMLAFVFLDDDTHRVFV